MVFLVTVTIFQFFSNENSLKSAVSLKLSPKPNPTSPRLGGLEVCNIRYHRYHISIPFGDGFIHPPYPPSRAPQQGSIWSAGLRLPSTMPFQHFPLYAYFSDSNFTSFRTRFRTPNWPFSVPQIADQHLPRYSYKKI